MSDLELANGVNGSQTWRAGVIAHRGFVLRNDDFGVADRGSIGTVHTRREWTGLRRVRAMQAPQPVHTSSGFLTLRLLKSSAADALGGWLVKA